eukprot:TRINITY_DN12075_c0_g1_i3.p1 TRINITY_DN12075_c0_g1~~TRINITY_DN12075_c0_g1_i3.p1  ORF type:complete len:228 (-),score=25.61 TRINITY_DN12075_c0_g1_i3:13-696(-)
MLAASLTDPGIYPRRPKVQVSDDPFAKAPYEPQRTQKVKDIELELRYCDTCSMYRPPRASHCSTCNNCVDRFDHHCPYLGNCVGRRNYRAFLYFIYTLKLNCVYIITFCAVRLAKIAEDSGGSAVVEDRSGIVSIALIVYCGLALAVLASLGGLHCKLTFISETTNENIKLSYNRTKKNPFAQNSWLRNMFYLFFPPWYPRYVDFSDEANVVKAVSQPNGKITDLPV